MGIAWIKVQGNSFVSSDLGNAPGSANVCCKVVVVFSNIWHELVRGLKQRLPATKVSTSEGNVARIIVLQLIRGCFRHFAINRLMRLKRGMERKRDG
jgi:hypothetical protein